MCLAEAIVKLTMKQIMEKYSDVFTRIGCLPGKYNIETNPLIPPVQNQERIQHVMKVLGISNLTAVEVG